MKYLIPFDFSPVSQNAVDQAIKFVEFTGGEISILHVVNDKELYRRKDLQLKQYIESLGKHENIIISGHVVVGNNLMDIGKIAEYHGIDLVMMGTHGVDAMQKIFGSNSMKIIRNSIVPFFIFQEGYKFKKLNKIVLPFSIETKSMQVLRFASKLSKLYDAEIHLIGRVQSDEYFRHSENTNILMASKFMKQEGVAFHFEILDVSKGEFQEKVLEYCEKIDSELIATTFYSDSLLPMFEKFVQNLIINKNHIPVLCINAETLMKVDSTLSFLTV
ncbi:MAG: universal stress protein [Bacteroidota bacterium]